MKAAFIRKSVLLADVGKKIDVAVVFVSSNHAPTPPPPPPLPLFVCALTIIADLQEGGNKYSAMALAAKLSCGDKLYFTLISHWTGSIYTGSQP